MKTTIKILIIVLTFFMLSGCEDPGVTTKHLTGAEDNLPYELRGLKVYSVSLGEGIRTVQENLQKIRKY